MILKEIRDFKAVLLLFRFYFLCHLENGVDVGLTVVIMPKDFSLLFHGALLFPSVKVQVIRNAQD